MKRKKIVLGK